MGIMSTRGVILDEKYPILNGYSELGKSGGGGGHAHALDKYWEQHHEAVCGELHRRKRVLSKKLK